MTKVVEELLRKKLSKMSPRAARNLINRPVRWRYPMGAEAKLRKALTLVFFTVGHKLVMYMETIKNSYTKGRRDSFESDLDGHIKRQIDNSLAAFLMGTTFTGTDVSKVVDSVLEDVKTLQFSEMANYYTKLIDTVPPYSDVWWNEVRRDVRTKIETSIQRTVQEFYSSVREYVIRAAREGMAFSDIIAGVQSMADRMTEYRAAFLARDIIGGYNAAMSKEIQTQIMGIHTYMWGTMGDERVRGNPEGYYPKARPSHFVMSRMICKWIDPSVYSPDGNMWIPRTAIMPIAHPGEPYQCRCGAVPYDVTRMNQLLAEIEASK